MARRHNLAAAVAAIQLSESDDESSIDVDSTEEEDEAPVQPDSDDEQSVASDSGSDYAPSSSDSDTPVQPAPRKRVRNADEPAQRPAAATLVGRNGHVWTTTAPNTGRAVKGNLLRQNDGLTGAVGPLTNIASCFKLFMTEDMLLLVVRETNRHGRNSARVWNDAHVADGNLQVWDETDIVEMRAFIGLLLYAGVHMSGGESMLELWSAKEGRPLFRATMSLNRFKGLLRHCRFDNGATRADRLLIDKFAPIRDFWEMFLVTLQLYYKPSSCLTVDEQLVATRGRFSFRQYIPSKPGKYGIKIFWVCDSETSFPLRGEVYVGQQPGAVANNNKVTDLVKRLVRPWVNTGRNITMDNYFTSVELACDMLAVNTTIVGTMRNNRKDIPNDLQASRKRDLYSSIFCFHDQLTLNSYVPRKGKSVIMLSTMHHDDTVDADNNNKPEIITYYNSTKSGVDNLDHLVGLYTCKRKTRRWPMTFFFNAIDTAGIASYTTWCCRYPDYQHGKSHKRRLFLLQLVEDLVTDQLTRRRSNPQSFQGGVKLAFRSLGMEPLRLVPPVAETDARQKRCVICPRTVDRKTKTRCSECGNHCCNEHCKITCALCGEDDM